MAGGEEWWVDEALGDRREGLAVDVCAWRGSPDANACDRGGEQDSEAAMKGATHFSDWRIAMRIGESGPSSEVPAVTSASNLPAVAMCWRYHSSPRFFTMLP